MRRTRERLAPARAAKPKCRFVPSKLFNNSFNGHLVHLLGSASYHSVTMGASKVILSKPKGGCLHCRARTRTGGPGETAAQAELSPPMGTPAPGASQRCKRCSTCQVGGKLEVLVNPWYYRADNIVNVADSHVHKWFREFLVHGTVWTGASNNTIHRSQRLAVLPLKSSDWPRNLLGPSWPSFPSIPEWMEMLRKGCDPFERTELNQPLGHAGYTSVSRRQVSENAHLATLIVANAIVGIRSSTEIPVKYRGYFRYRWNFLILTVNYALPIGLVRFLLAQWCTRPFSLWLRRSVTFKKFLKKVPISLVKRGESQHARYDALRATQAENDRCTPVYDYSSESYSGGESDLD